MIGDFFLRWTELHSTGPPFQLENPRLTFGTSIGLSSQNLRKPQKSLRTFVLVLVFPKFLCRNCSSVCAPFGFGGVCETSSPFIALRQAPFIVLFCLFISFRDCNIPLALSAVFNANQVSPKLFSSTTFYVLRFWLRARWHNVIGIHGAGGTAVVCWSGYSTLPPSLPSAYLARLIWSHLPLLYYTHCVMVEDGIWKKIWLIRDRVYEQE